MHKRIIAAAMSFVMLFLSGVVFSVADDTSLNAVEPFTEDTTPQDHTVPVSEDTFTEINNSNALGNNGILHARNAGGNYRHIFIKVDASSFTGITANSVKLRLFTYEWFTSSGGIDYFNPSKVNLTVYKLADKNWSESSLVYSDTEKVSEGKALLTEVKYDFTNESTKGGDHWIDIDLTDYFNSEQDKILSLRIDGTDGERYRFVSSNALTSGNLLNPTAGSLATSDPAAYHPHLVVNAYKPPVAVTGITLKDKTTLNSGQQETLIPTVLPVTADNKSVTWQSSNPYTASVSENGVVTAKNPGNADITATTVDGGFSAVCNVTVNPPASVESISLSSTALNLNAMDTTSVEASTLTATIFPADAVNKVITWHSENPDIATVAASGSIHPQPGIVTPLKKGVATIVATTADGNMTASCEVTVNEAIKVEQVVLNKERLDNLPDNSTQQILTATIKPDSAGNKTVTWSSSDKNVATVSQKGVVSPRNPGTAVITASSADGPKAECVVTVKSVCIPEDGMFTVKKVVSDDTYLHGPGTGMTAVVSGRELVLQTRGVGGNDRYILVKSDMSEYANCQVVRARLVFTQHSYEDVVSGSTTIVPATRNIIVRGFKNNKWSESTSSYDNLLDNTLVPPALPQTSDMITTAAFDADNIDGEISFDVTKYYTEYNDENLVASFILIAAENTRLYLYPKEAGTSKAPYVELTLKPITFKQEGKNVTASINSAPISGKASSNTIIAAIYNNEGTMVEAAFKQETTQPGNLALLKASVDGMENNRYAKAFFWDTLSSMKPYYAAATINGGAELPQSGSGTGAVSVSGREINIKGIATAGEFIGIEVLKPGKTGDNISSIMEDMIHIYQVETDSNGSFSTRFNMPVSATDGVYTLRVRGSQSADIATTEFLYRSAQINIIDEVSTAQSASELMRVLIPYNALLGLNNSNIYKEMYPGLTNEKKTELFETLYTKKADMTTSGMAGSIFEQYLALKTLKWTNDPAKVRGILELSKTALGISSSDWNSYVALTDSGSIDRQLAGEVFNDIGGFNAAFSEALNSKSSSGTSYYSTGGGGGGGGSSFIPAPVLSNTLAAVDNSGSDKPESSPADMFSDLSGYEWAKDSILKLAEKGIVAGKGSKIFAPGDNITRAEFTKIVVEAFGLVDESASCTFADVTQADWYYKYAASAQTHSIIKGNDQNEFCSDQNITRQDMAILLYRVSELLGMSVKQINDPIEFKDDDEISDYAKEAVKCLQQAAIINGIGDGLFGPLQNATRAQAAVMVERFITLLP